MALPPPGNEDACEDTELSSSSLEGKHSQERGVVTDCTALGHKKFLSLGRWGLPD